MPQADTIWRDALLVDAGRIAGVRVRPLSAWHCHVAQMLGVRLGISEAGRGPTPGDIAQAVAICRSRYRPGRAGAPCAGWWLLRVWLPIRWLFRDWRKDASDLLQYWETYQRRPEVVRKAGQEGVPLGAPPFFAMALNVSILIPSVPLEEALNMPLSTLFLMRATAVELSGGPACAWASTDSIDDVKKALATAQAAIDRYNAANRKPEAANG